MVPKTQLLSLVKAAYAEEEAETTDAGSDSEAESDYSFTSSCPGASESERSEEQNLARTIQRRSRLAPTRQVRLAGRFFQGTPLPVIPGTPAAHRGSWVEDASSSEEEEEEPSRSARCKSLFFPPQLPSPPPQCPAPAADVTPLPAPPAWDSEGKLPPAPPEVPPALPQAVPPPPPACSPGAVLRTPPPGLPPPPPSFDALLTVAPGLPPPPPFAAPAFQFAAGPTEPPAWDSCRAGRSNAVRPPPGLPPPKSSTDQGLAGFFSTAPPVAGTLQVQFRTAGVQGAAAVAAR
eukprot:TRINITY_DN80089_c0_g1_i1.p1 TRINITY_DN80089_c0_g1~~TRINITY_DN80089_c0_g1_i1.p1  ORF type:complete len:291 (+),score=61.33 TRINITY_DN80089_c0_g1_i1:91-963(+)